MENDGYFQMTGCYKNANAIYAQTEKIEFFFNCKIVEK